MNNRQKLRDYFFAVTKDMLDRGVIRRQQGQLLEDVLKAEAPAVLKEVQEDLSAVGTELGMTFIAGAKSYLESTMQKMVSQGLDAGIKGFFDFLASGKDKKK